MSVKVKCFKLAELTLNVGLRHIFPTKIISNPCSELFFCFIDIFIFFIESGYKNADKKSHLVPSHCVIFLKKVIFNLAAVKGTNINERSLVIFFCLSPSEKFYF